VLFAIAALTDFFDGLLARRWAQTSVFGNFLDTTADKLLVAGALIGRCWWWGGCRRGSP
jgi:phosphatidylglycerophosphate synthase